MENIRDLTLQAAPRILGFIDRDENSGTYGCCDRYFWHYKLSDIANARFQEACLLLALLYSNDFEGNIYYRSKSVLGWILAVIDFWLSRSHKDGSFAEVYPYERSFCATAFSAFAITESILTLLNGEGQEAKKAIEGYISQGSLLEKIEKSGRWILRNQAPDAANQLAAGAAGLWNIRALSANQQFGDASREIFNSLLRGVSQYGYFPEYGGFDIGYSSITNSILAWQSDKPGDNQELINAIKTVNSAIEKELDEFGNYDYSLTSRNTQFLFIYGALKTKSRILSRVLTGIARNKIITPLWLDDRYCLGMLIDYLKAYIEYSKWPKKP